MKSKLSLFLVFSLFLQNLWIVQPIVNAESFENTKGSGILSHVNQMIVHEGTAPEQPIVDPVSDMDTILTGKAEPLAKITIWNNNGSFVGNGIVNGEGNFSVLITQQFANDVLIITATDEAGNISEAVYITVLDKKPPQIFSIYRVADSFTGMAGVTEAFATVIAKVNGIQIGKATADHQGNFKIAFPAKQAAGTLLEVIAIDEKGNASEPTVVTVVDNTPPAMAKIDAIFEYTELITGTAEKNSTIKLTINKKVIIYVATNKDGSVSVPIEKQKAGTPIKFQVIDAAGNISFDSLTKFVRDGYPPKKPIVNKLDDNDKILTGKTQPGALIIVYHGTKNIGSTSANKTGEFTVKLSASQKARTVLTIHAIDNGGKSEGTKVTVADKTAPTAPKVNKVDSNDKKVTGTAEAGSTINIKVGKKIIGTAKTNSKGNFTVKIKVQKTNTYLYVTATDSSKNVSVSKKVKVVKSK